MKLSEEDLLQLCSLAIEAASAAGKHIAVTRPLHVRQDKEGDNLASQVLTEVDGQSQDIILGMLEQSFAEYDLALLTEESPDDGSRFEKDCFWCIDPIDGTLPFIESVAGCAVSIALVSRSGEPLIGVVYDPVEQALYHAVKGRGAYRNDEPWRLSEPDCDIRIFTDRSIAAYAYCDEVASALHASVRGQGGAVMNAMWSLEHPPACYFKFPKEEKGGGCIWDYAATACIYCEAGAWVSDMSGQPLNLNTEHNRFNDVGILFATNRELADQVIALKETLYRSIP